MTTRHLGLLKILKEKGWKEKGMGGKSWRRESIRLVYMEIPQLPCYAGVLRYLVPIV